MTPFTVSRSSWHFKFIKMLQGRQLDSLMYAHRKGEELMNTCNYVNLFLWSIWWAMVLTAAGSISGFLMLVVPVATVLQAVFGVGLNLTEQQIHVGFTVMLFEFVITLVILYFVFLHDRVSRYFANRKLQKVSAPPTSFSTIAHSYHSKICVPLEIKD